VCICICICKQYIIQYTHKHTHTHTQLGQLELSAATPAATPCAQRVHTDTAHMALQTSFDLLTGRSLLRQKSPTIEEKET
jgi:hypothetical protein